MNQTKEKKVPFQFQQENPFKLKLKEKFGQNILYIDPNNYSMEMKQFNFRNPTYGVTVEYQFLTTIQECAFLESSQLQFFMNLFRKAYSNIKLAAATCYFFTDLILTSQKSIQPQSQPQIIKLDWKRPNVEVKPQEQNKIEDPPNPIIQNTMASQQNNQQEFNQDSLQMKQLSLNNNDKSQLVQPKKQEKLEIHNQVKQQSPNSHVIHSNSKNQVKLELQQSEKIKQNQKLKYQSQQKQQHKSNVKKNQDSQNINNNQDIKIIGKKQQITKQNQKKHQTKNILLKPKSNSIKKNFEMIPNSNSKNENNIEQNEEKNQVLINQNNVQDKIIQKQTDPIIQEKQKVPLEQTPIKQVQVENQLQQSPPEKKYHFQIINIQELAPPQEIIQKSQLGQLMKQFAEVNNLQEDQLKDQDYWFFPINLQQAHWISMVVQFNPQQIYYFDSYFKNIDPQMINGIHSILKYYNFDPNKFQIKPIYNKQANGYDCGIFLLLSLLYTLKNQEYDYNQIQVDKFRKKILYNMAVIGAQTDITKDSFEYLITQE